MFCTNCGNKLNGEGQYCTNCGNNINNVFNPNNSLKSDNIVITVILIVVIGLILGSFLFVYLGYNYRINSKTSLFKIPYANQTVGPGEMITADMISYMEVPGNFIVGTYYRSDEDIVGKCSNFNTMIADGSIFYKDIVIDCDKLLVYVDDFKDSNEFDEDEENLEID